MCPPLAFNRCPYHHIGFCRNVLISDNNRRGYVISYTLCRHQHQVTIFFKFFGDHQLQKYISPPFDIAQYNTLNKLLNLPYSRLYLFSNVHHIRLTDRHRKEWISQMSYTLTISLYKKLLINVSLLCLTMICYAFCTTLAQIVRLHPTCMYIAISMMISIKSFCPQLWILLFYSSW